MSTVTRFVTKEGEYDGVSFDVKVGVLFEERQCSVTSEFWGSPCTEQWTELEYLDYHWEIIGHCYDIVGDIFPLQDAAKKVAKWVRENLDEIIEEADERGEES